jgi:hypothetical protein
MKQKFRGKQLLKWGCVQRLTHYYSLATESEIKDGINWYSEANVFCQSLAKECNVSIQQVSGIVAAFSPQAGWIENKRYASTYLKRGKALRTKVQIGKAEAILKTENLDEIESLLAYNKGALKSKAFYKNILLSEVSTGVTIDRHAVAACLQHHSETEALPAIQMTESQYRFFESAYIEAAKKVGILPHQFQAVVWVVYRRLRGLTSHKNNELKESDPF